MLTMPSCLPTLPACLPARPPAVDESEREQGIAHLVEHVTFLGSKKREGLLGTGARCGGGGSCTAHTVLCRQC
jgi:hypothetical protein